MSNPRAENVGEPSSGIVLVIGVKGADGNNASLVLDASARLPVSLSGSLAGPTTPALSLSVVPAQSAAVCTWQVATTSTPAALVPAWVSNTAKLAGEPVTAGGNVYRYGTSGTTAGSGSGPAATDTSPIVDGTSVAYYVGPVATAFRGGFVAVNIDATNIAYYGTDPAVTTSKATGALVANGGSISLNAPPAMFYLVSAGATVTVTAQV